MSKKKTFLTAWEEIGRDLMERHHHDGLPASSLQELQDRFPRNAAADANGFFNLIGVIYAAGYYKGYEAAKPRTETQGDSLDLYRDIINEAAKKCDDWELLDLIAKLFVMDGNK